MKIYDIPVLDGVGTLKFKVESNKVLVDQLNVKCKNPSTEFETKYNLSIDSVLNFLKLLIATGTIDLEDQEAIEAIKKSISDCAKKFKQTK